MTSGAQPPNSGAPTPVQGVTGGPPVLGGQISNDPSTGNVVIAPNPGNVLQIRKGSNPQSLQVYEYFHSSTDYSRIALNSQTNGPFSLAVETAPSTVIRALNISANGAITVTAGGLLTLVATQVNVPESLNTNQVLTGSVNAQGGTLNLAGSASPFSVIFSIGASQPWAFIPSNAFTPTANNVYDIGQAGVAVRTAYLAAIDYNGAGNIGQGNGGVGTVPLVRGTGFGPAAVAGVGWLRFFVGGSAVYIPYWQ